MGTWFHLKNKETLVQISNSSLVKSIIIDFSVCSGKSSVFTTFGSTIFEFNGIKNNKCSLSYGLEAEMGNRSWYSCLVPTNLGKKSFYATDAVNLSELKPYCMNDVYPLYTGATWGKIQAITSPDFGPVTLIESFPFLNITNISEISDPFMKYYHNKLISTGWTQDMSREAGGPGSEISVYTKLDQFTVVSFSSEFTKQHPDAPSECPCNVQFKLMHGVKK
jgi:hypothetical protein